MWFIGSERESLEWFEYGWFSIADEGEARDYFGVELRAATHPDGELWWKLARVRLVLIGDDRLDDYAAVAGEPDTVDVDRAIRDGNAAIVESVVVRSADAADWEVAS